MLDIDDSPILNDNSSYTNQINCLSYPLSDVGKKISASNFNLLSVNVRSLKAHYDDLSNLLASLPLGFFDVLALQEVWSVNSSFQLSGYQKIIFTSRDKGKTINPNCGGGLAFYVRENIEFELLEKQSVFIKGLYESIWIKLKLPKKKSVIIGNVYRPNTLPLGNVTRAIEIHSEIHEGIKMIN